MQRKSLLLCREAWHLSKCFSTKCSLRHLKSTNRKVDSVVKTAIHKCVDKTVENCTKSQKNIINAKNDEIRPKINKTVKVCSIIQNKTNKSDLIDVKENNKPETDLVGVDIKYSEILKSFSKLTETRDLISINKPQKHKYLEIIKQAYLNFIYFTTVLFMQTMIQTVGPI